MFLPKRHDHAEVLDLLTYGLGECYVCIGQVKLAIKGRP